MNELYKKISELCDDNHIKIGKMCDDLGISRGNISDIKMGRKKALSASNIAKVANYFGVSTDYLLGVDATPPKSKLDDITLDDFTYAMYNESGHLTEEQKDQLLSLAQLFAQKQKEREQHKE